jgi:hypothetical protein
VPFSEVGQKWKSHCVIHSGVMLKRKRRKDSDDAHQPVDTTKRLKQSPDPSLELVTVVERMRWRHCTVDDCDSKFKTNGDLDLQVACAHNVNVQWFNCTFDD